MKRLFPILFAVAMLGVACGSTENNEAASSEATISWTITPTSGSGSSAAIGNVAGSVHPSSLVSLPSHMSMMDINRRISSLPNIKFDKSEFRSLDIDTLAIVRSLEFSDSLRNATIERLERLKLQREQFLALQIDSLCLPIVVAPNDEIKITATGGENPKVDIEGSDETRVLVEFMLDYYKNLFKIDCDIANLDKLSPAVRKRVGQLATETMRKQVNFVMENPHLLASYYVLYLSAIESRFPQLEGKGINLYHMKRVLEVLEKRYPDSPYIQGLKADVEYREEIARIEASMTEIAFPEIRLEDMYNNAHSLSSMEGNVIVLYFWSPADTNALRLNEELKDIYAKWHDNGLEIYQVAAGMDRAAWISTIREQQLPWTSVFSNAPAPLMTYNVDTLPKVYIIDRDGTLNACEASANAIKREVKKLL